MFREYTRRRELALGRSAAYKFVIDGESIESEHTARMVHLGERDVVLAVLDTGEAPADGAKPPGKAAPGPAGSGLFREDRACRRGWPPS